MNHSKLSQYNIIHSHANAWFTSLCHQTRNENCKWVHTYHTLYFEEDYPDGLANWQKEINSVLINIAPKADVKICISKWLKNYLSKKYAIETTLITNGVDIIECDKASAERFIKKYHLSDFILYIGNLQSVKNPKLFVELAKQMPKIKFAMIGRNIDEIHLEREYKVLVPENLILLNEIKHEDAMDAISACKAFVMTSKREGIPTALLEAMAMGKPVVVPNHSGCKEVVCNDENGFLYNQDSFDDLLNKTRQAISPNYKGEGARKRILQEYDWNIIIKKIDLLYQSCISNSKKIGTIK
jgi:glycosyltransferase involved in cell wall biosynthesis